MLTTPQPSEASAPTPRVPRSFRRAQDAIRSHEGVLARHPDSETVRQSAADVSRLVLVGGPQLVRGVIAGLINDQPGMLVEQSFESVAELEAEYAATPLSCDLILLDVDDAPGACAELVDRMLAIGLRCKLVLLAAEATDEIVSCASTRTVDGVVLKDSSLVELRDAITHIRTGHAVMPARWHAVPDSAELTPRHLEVLRLVAAGYTTAEIALRLGLRPNTVKFHISEIFRRLGARNRIEAITVLAGSGKTLVH